MSHDLFLPALIVLSGLSARGRRLIAEHAAGARGDDGVSTLEMVIIALGLIAVATLLIAAITAAVTRRTNQIN